MQVTRIFFCQTQKCCFGTTKVYVIPDIAERCDYHNHHHHLIREHPVNVQQVASL
jgi:hypothetical protein